MPTIHRERSRTLIGSLFALLCLFTLPAAAQVPVALAPSMHPQFLTSAGQPLSGGVIFTYQSGTTTRQDTYTDSTGTIINAWPIPLDATGAPSNGSTQTGIWLSNNAYKFCGYNSALVQQWCTDNVSAYQILNGVQNIVFGSVTSDPTGAAGELGYRSDIPCFRGYTTFWDCFVTLTGIQTLTNKTLTAPVINNATGATLISPSITGLTIGSVVSASNNPTNFTSYTNDTVTGTTLNTLTKLKAVGSGSASVITTAGDTGGVEGVTIAGAGTSGSSMIQKSGQILCVFDGSTTVLDYVQISPTVNGNCHDTGGTTYPTSGGQVIGRVLTTNAGVGIYLLDLFAPEIRTGGTAATIGCTAIGPVTVGNSVALTTLFSCVIPANSLTAGSLLAVDITGIESTAVANGINLISSLGGGTSCQSVGGTTGVANNQPWNAYSKWSILTAGVGGTMNASCGYASTPSGGTPAVSGPNGIIGAPTVAINTTIANTLLVQVQMSAANAGNTITAQLLKAVIY